MGNKSSTARSPKARRSLRRSSMSPMTDSSFATAKGYDFTPDAKTGTTPGTMPYAKFSTTPDAKIGTTTPKSSFKSTTIKDNVEFVEEHEGSSPKAIHEISQSAQNQEHYRGMDSKTEEKVKELTADAWILAKELYNDPKCNMTLKECFDFANNQVIKSTQTYIQGLTMARESNRKERHEDHGQMLSYLKQCLLLQSKTAQADQGLLTPVKGASSPKGKEESPIFSPPKNLAMQFEGLGMDEVEEEDGDDAHEDSEEDAMSAGAEDDAKHQHRKVNLDHVDQ